MTPDQPVLQDGDALLPCPFCGSAKVDVGASQEVDPSEQEWSVLCCDCGASCSLYCKSQQDAVASWNTRTPAAGVTGTKPAPAEYPVGSKYQADYSLLPAPDAMREAFIAGAEAVHREWVRCHADGEGPPRGDPDFSEAANDYALSPAPLPSGDDPEPECAPMRFENAYDADGFVTEARLVPVPSGDGAGDKPNMQSLCDHFNLVLSERFETMVLAAMHSTLGNEEIKALTVIQQQNGVEIERASVPAILFASEILDVASPSDAGAAEPDTYRCDKRNCFYPECDCRKPAAPPVRGDREAIAKLIEREAHNVMADKALMESLANAIRAVNNLSVAAKAARKHDLMYAANRAWHQLYKAEHARAQPEKR